MASTAAIQGVSFLKLILQINVPRKVTILTDGKAKMCLRDGTGCPTSIFAKVKAHISKTKAVGEKFQQFSMFHEGTFHMRNKNFSDFIVHYQKIE